MSHRDLRLAILGATGGIGGHLLTWALDAGHPVHALARSPQALPARTMSSPVNAILVSLVWRTEGRANHGENIDHH